MLQYGANFTLHCSLLILRTFSNGINGRCLSLQAYYIIQVIFQRRLGICVIFYKKKIYMQRAMLRPSNAQLYFQSQLENKSRTYQHPFKFMHIWAVFQSTFRGKAFGIFALFVVCVYRKDKYSRENVFRILNGTSASRNDLHG